MWLYAFWGFERVLRPTLAADAPGAPQRTPVSLDETDWNCPFCCLSLQQVDLKRGWSICIWANIKNSHLQSQSGLQFSWFNKKTYQKGWPAVPARWRTGVWCCVSTLQTAAGGPKWGWWGPICWWDQNRPVGEEPECWSVSGHWSRPCSQAWWTHSSRVLSFRSPTRRSRAR